MPILHREITDLILRAFYKTHTDLGYGFLESIYVNALCALLRHYGLKVQREVPFEMTYYGDRAGYYRADVIVEGKVLVEGQTGLKISPAYLLRTRNYLRVTRLNVGLLLNWGPDAQFKRMVQTDGRVTITASRRQPGQLSRTSEDAPPDHRSASQQ